MKYIKQLAVILAVSFVGEVLSAMIPLPVPAGIYGIVILFVMLMTKLLPLSAVENVGDFLIEVMPLMFIPAAVGLIDSYGRVKSSIVAYLVIAVVSTVLVMAVSGLVTQTLIRLKRKGEDK